MVTAGRYFMIITSAEMADAKAAERHKIHDVSGKRFRVDKSFLRNRIMRACNKSGGKDYLHSVLKSVSIFAQSSFPFAYPVSALMKESIHLSDGIIEDCSGISVLPSFVID